MLGQQQHYLKVFDMPAKRHRKRPDEPTSNSQTLRPQQPHPKIKFDICKDNIACFIGQKRSIRKRNVKGSASLKKGRHSHGLSQPKKEVQQKPKAISMAIKQTDSEQLVQGSLNTILSQIESKGIGCVWSEGEYGLDQNAQNQTSELWRVFSVTESVEKSPASTMDVRPNVNYYMEQSSFNYPNYSYSNYGYKTYEEGSVFLLRADDILSDPRTTVMIRNIPNKYTIKELSEEIDYDLANTYDFLYLPCDIKNQCNVGYGFINFIDTQHLEEFYREFQGRRWAKFRSEKICNLTYARLQGLHNLINHFENSKVLNQKDKKYRPIIRELGEIGNLIKTQQLN